MRRRFCIDRVRDKLGVSERRACRLLKQHRTTQRHIPRGREDEDRLVGDMIELARQYGRYGYPVPRNKYPVMRMNFPVTGNKFPVNIPREISCKVL